MPPADVDLRDALERLARPPSSDGVFEEVADRRRRARRRRRGGQAGLIAIVGLAAMGVLLVRDGGTHQVVHAGPSVDAVPRWTRVVVSADGATLEVTVPRHPCTGAPAVTAEADAAMVSVRAQPGPLDDGCEGGNRIRRVATSLGLDPPLGRRPVVVLAPDSRSVFWRSAVPDADGRRLTVSWTGDRCTDDWHLAVIERDDQVEISAYEGQPSSGACDGGRVTRVETVDLARPLGQRELVGFQLGGFAS